MRTCNNGGYNQCFIPCNRFLPKQESVVTHTHITCCFFNPLNIKTVVIDACLLDLVNGGWSHFGSYSHCSVSCGGGNYTRSRTCTNPAPQHGGQDCVGSSTETHSCNTNPCPGRFHYYL